MHFYRTFHHCKKPNSDLFFPPITQTISLPIITACKAEAAKSPVSHQYQGSWRWVLFTSVCLRHCPRCAHGEHERDVGGWPWHSSTRQHLSVTLSGKICLLAETWQFQISKITHWARKWKAQKWCSRASVPPFLLNPPQFFCNVIARQTLWFRACGKILFRVSGQHKVAEIHRHADKKRQLQQVLHWRPLCLCSTSHSGWMREIKSNLI